MRKGFNLMDHEHDEWRDAVNDFTEWDWAPYDEPTTYADTMDLNGVRQ